MTEADSFIRMLYFWGCYMVVMVAVIARYLKLERYLVETRFIHQDFWKTFKEGDSRRDATFMEYC